MHVDARSAGDSLVSRLGSQIRSLRNAAGLSGQDLAQASGVSPSMLSRIETGQVSASVDTLGRIAVGLGVPVAQLFADDGGAAEFSLVRKGRGVPIVRQDAVHGYREELLGHLRARPVGLEPCLVRVDAMAGRGRVAPHSGTKFVYLLMGRLRYRCGAEVLACSEGDSLLFDASAPHGVEEVLCGPASYLSVLLVSAGGR